MKNLILLLFITISFYTNAQVQLDSTNLPIIIINTKGLEIPDEPKIEAEMKIIDNGDGELNHITDSVYAYDDKIGIEIRGSSSQMFPKKSYGFETRDSAGENNDVALLGLPKENDWVLYAPYSDKTLLRNVLVYKLANQLGVYASRSKFCEVILNGKYIGVYVLLEKIKRNKNRVNIKKLEPEDNADDALTGGYIVQIDRVDNTKAGWYSPYKPRANNSAKVWYVIEYPKTGDLIPEQENYIKTYVTNFEAVMNRADYNNPFTGYYDLININTFIDFYLINEFSKNVDAYRLSTFMYKDRDSKDGKLCLGPVWDFNLAFGNGDYDFAYLSSGWEAYVNNNSDLLSPFWVAKLISDPLFLNNFKARWNELKNTVFNYDSISNYIDTQTILIENARERNFQTWPVIGTYVWPNYYIGISYKDEIDYLKNFIKDRTSWINSMLDSNFGVIKWENPILEKVSNEVKLPLNSFIDSLYNIDSVAFLSEDGKLNLSLVDDSLIIKVVNSGNYNFRGAGYINGKIVSLSPLYNINTERTSVSSGDDYYPKKFNLEQNYPNPFNPITIIRYSLPERSYVSLQIFDLLGREVTTLIQGEKSPGNYEIEFNSFGLSSGVYFYKLTTDNYLSIKKMIVIK